MLRKLFCTIGAHQEIRLGTYLICTHCHRARPIYQPWR